MNTMTDTYTTPEGFELHRRLLLPDVRDFAELLTAVKPWNFATMNHRNGVPGPEHLEDLEFDGNYITAFCSVKQPGRQHLAVRPTELTLEALRGQLVTMGDSLSFKVIYHEANNRSLVLIDHNRIIGSRWLAYIDPATVPTFEQD